MTNIDLAFEDVQKVNLFVGGQKYSPSKIMLRDKGAADEIEVWPPPYNDVLVFATAHYVYVMDHDSLHGDQAYNSIWYTSDNIIGLSNKGSVIVVWVASGNTYYTHHFTVTGIPVGRVISWPIYPSNACSTELHEYAGYGSNLCCDGDYHEDRREIYANSLSVANNNVFILDDDESSLGIIGTDNRLSLFGVMVESNERVFACYNNRLGYYLILGDSGVLRKSIDITQFTKVAVLPAGALQMSDFRGGIAVRYSNSIQTFDADGNKMTEFAVRSDCTFQSANGRIYYTDGQLIYKQVGSQWVRLASVDSNIKFSCKLT